MGVNEHFEPIFNAVSCWLSDFLKQLLRAGGATVKGVVTFVAMVTTL
jgi:hypothetical protein